MGSFLPVLRKTVQSRSEAIAEAQSSFPKKDEGREII